MTKRSVKFTKPDKASFLVDYSESYEEREKNLRTKRRLAWMFYTEVGVSVILLIVFYLLFFR